MKNTSKFLVVAALTGLIAARPALADSTAGLTTNAPSTDKNTCKGKSGCKGHDSGDKKADKNSCKSKSGCKSNL